MVSPRWKNQSTISGLFIDYHRRLHRWLSSTTQPLFCDLSSTFFHSACLLYESAFVSSSVIKPPFCLSAALLNKESLHLFLGGSPGQKCMVNFVLVTLLDASKKATSLSLSLIEECKRLSVDGCSNQKVIDCWSGGVCKKWSRFPVTIGT